MIICVHDSNSMDEEIAGSNQELLGSAETSVDSFAELMAPEEAERYLKFLENESMEGKRGDSSHP